MSDESTRSAWRVQQQAMQLNRLIADAGGQTELLGQLERLGDLLDERASFTDEARQLSAEVGDRSARGFDELTRLQERTDTIDRMARTLYDDLHTIAQIDLAAADTAADVLDALQEARMDTAGSRADR